MAIQFVPQEPDSGLGQILGGLGGFGAGLLGSYVGKQVSLPGKIKKFEAFGANPEQAKALANSSESQQTAWLKEAMKEQARQQQAAMFSNLVSGGGQQLPMQPKSPQVGVSALGALGGPEQAQMPQTEQEPRDVSKVLGGKSVEELQEYRDKVLRSGGDPTMIKDAVAILDRQIMEKAKLESGKRKEALEEKKFSLSEQREVNKETKPFYDSIKAKSRDAKENEVRLDRMEELVKEGKLVGPGFAKAMEKLGIPLDPNSSEFQKLSNDFLKNAKSVFGSRVTEGEIKLYLQTVPNLNMPDAAKLRLINNLKIMSEGAKAENEAMKQIIKENGGKRPADLEDRVEERTKDIKDRLAQEFKSGFRNAEIAEETGLEQAERLLTGPATGVAGAALKAAPGAIVGGILGGPVGAAIGGLGGGALTHLLGMLGR